MLYVIVSTSRDASTPAPAARWEYNSGNEDKWFVAPELIDGQTKGKDPNRVRIVVKW
jgi:hypothetical protein